MKAILVLDEMPSSCLKCELSADDDFTCFCVVNSMECSTIKRPDWCPLKPLPDKKPHAKEFLEVFINTGYNACINEILGDKE